MTLKNLPTQLLVATLSCTVPVVVGVSAPAVAFDYNLDVTLGNNTVPKDLPQLDFSNKTISGTFSTPDNQPVSTYIGNLPAFRVGPTQEISQGDQRQSVASEDVSAVGDGGRKLDFGNRFTVLNLTFSSDPATSSGLTFSSGYYLGIGSGLGNYPVTDATITPVPAPASVGDFLFLPVLAYWRWRQKRQPKKLLNVLGHDAQPKLD